jgi:hypothetical protein
MNNKSKVSTKWAIFGCQMFGVAVLLTIATVGTAFAETITKTFEFGPGVAQLRSHFRTFTVPCRRAVAVTVKFRTLGPAGASNEVPIIIELVEPFVAEPFHAFIAETKNATARATEQTVTLSGQKIARGCSLHPWWVRVKHANEGTPPFITTGSIKLDFDGGGVRNLNFDGPGFIGKHLSKTVDLASGLDEEGKIVLTGDWTHSIAGVTQGPNPIKLRFTLIHPNGAVVKTAEGFANRQRERELGLPILKLIYQVKNCTGGQWKLEITNLNQNDDVNLNKIDGTFTPGCP